MNIIDYRETSKHYNSIEKIWDINEKWHWVTHEMIKSFIWRSLDIIQDIKNIKILNAGSAGNSYGLNENSVIHIDIAKNQILNLSNSILSNIEDLPLKNNTFDLIICVGSVINYCDPLRAFMEFKRLLTKNGYILIEFESSRTLELIGTQKFNKKIVLTDTFYKGGVERLWYFSEVFIKELALNFNLEIYSKDKCHLISPLIYRIIKNEGFASNFAKLDNFCKKIPFINYLASNVIYLLRSID